MTTHVNIYIHRLMLSPSWVPVALDRLREHGIEAQATSYDVISGKTCVDWQGPRDQDIDFLRPDILPPRAKK